MNVPLPGVNSYPSFVSQVRLCSEVPFFLEGNHSPQRINTYMRWAWNHAPDTQNFHSLAVLPST